MEPEMPIEEGVGYPKALEMLLEDKDLRNMFAYVSRELRLGNLNSRQEAIVQRHLSFIYRLVVLTKYYGVELNPAIEYLYGNVISIIIASRSRYGFERKMQVTSRQLVEEEKEEKQAEEKRRLGFLFGRW